MPGRRMNLSDYLDAFSWSQAELARQAKISPRSVARAIKGETIKRKNAEAIIDALQRKHKEKGLKGAITLASIQDLRISKLNHRKASASQDQDQSDQNAVD